MQKNMNSGHSFKHVFKPIKVNFNPNACLYAWLGLDTR